MCSLLVSLFISFSLILLSSINDENNRYHNLRNDIVSDILDIKTLLKTQWSDETEELLARKFIKLYSIDSHASSNKSPWTIANDWVSSTDIHPDSPAELGFVLESMKKGKIIWADVGHKGTQLKLTISFEGGQSAIFKPKWYDRDTIIQGQPYDGHDRHNGEIASFHLSRILGLRRAPLVVGRIVDLQKEIIPVSSQKLGQTFFTKEGGDICFLGKCLYCRTKEDAACGRVAQMEGAIVLWFPKFLALKQYRHPWSRTYNAHRKAKWELANTSNNYCDNVQQMPPYDSSKQLLLDIIDTSIFDFLIGNADRHHFEVFANYTIPRLLLIDNAKSFGNPNHDERSILAPLMQCKLIRKSTVIRLNELKNGLITRALKAVLFYDPLAPILTDPHLAAIGRRLNLIIDILIRGEFGFV